MKDQAQIIAEQRKEMTQWLIEESHRDSKVDEYGLVIVVVGILTTVVGVCSFFT